MSTAVQTRPVIEDLPVMVDPLDPEYIAGLFAKHKMLPRRGGWGEGGSGCALTVLLREFGDRVVLLDLTDDTRWGIAHGFDGKASQFVGVASSEFRRGLVIGRRVWELVSHGKDV